MIDNATEIEVRLEPRPGNRIAASARLGSQTANRVFGRESPEAELFLWLAEEFRHKLASSAPAALRE